MSKKISDMFDYGADIDAGETDTMFDPEKIKALAFGKINAPVPVMKGKRKMNIKKVLLIAATVVIAIMCSAFTLYKFGVFDLILPEEGVVNGYTGVSVTGWKDTPEYKALTEWKAYVSEYTKTNELPNIVTDGTPIEYQIAGAWSQESAAKLDEILKKYDLRLHGVEFINLPAPDSGIDTNAILSCEKNWVGGYAYADGTMRLDSEIITENGNVVNLCIFNSVKGTFTDITGGMSIGADYKEWEYTAADGTSLVLGHSGEQGVIIADMEHSFATANISPVGSDEELEAIADMVGWKQLNACSGYSKEFYEKYAAQQEELNKEDVMANDAENEMGRLWGATQSVGVTHHVVVYGRASEQSENGCAWVERRYTSDTSDAVISIKYERYKGDAQKALENKLSDLGMNVEAEMIENVPVYIEKMSDGGLRAVWLYESEGLLFTISSDAGELTDETLREQIVYILTGKDTGDYEGLEIPVM